MEIHDKLDELGEVIESARAVPMSASCMVNRADVLALLDQVRRQLPSDLTRADALLADAEGVRRGCAVAGRGDHRRRPRGEDAPGLRDRGAGPGRA